VTRLSWSVLSDRFFETGLDRGVLYPPNKLAYSTSSQTVSVGSKTFVLAGQMLRPFRPGVRATVRAQQTINTYLSGIVISATSGSVTIDVDEVSGTGTYDSWKIDQASAGVAWNGLTAVDESGGESATPYYVDGRPFLYLPKPREFAAQVQAYTYPEEFEQIMGMEEAADGMYLDSQMQDSFGMSYRTLVGDAVGGAAANYKIHLIYNATAVFGSVSRATNGSEVNAVTFSWDINAVPVPVEGFRPTAHITIDTRHMDPDLLSQIEDLIYGDGDSEPTLPDPQIILDILSYGDAIIITDLGDGLWEARASYRNLYVIGDGVFQIDNVNATDLGDGEFEVSSTP
jgi:hypothetical protein